MDDTGVIIPNMISFVVAFAVMLLIALGGLAGVLGVSSGVFRWFGSAAGSGAQAAWRRRVKRTWLLLVALLMVLLGAGFGFATWQQIRIDLLVWDQLFILRQEDLLAGAMVIARVLGIIALAVLANAVLRTLMTLLTTRLKQAQWAERRGENLAEVLLRLRFAVGAIVLLAALAAIAGVIGLPESLYSILLLPAYIGAAIYGSRFIVYAAHLVIEVLFEMSDRLAALESPIRYLGSLTHLAGLTKRTVEYFVYVSAATWVLDQITPGTWLSAAGNLGIRIIAIFYISRVLVEVCLLFMNEILLARRPEQSDAEYQQRQTLVPVAGGLVRYGIYFAALVTILREAGIDPTAVLAGAGIVGIAVGLGAQAFVGDVVAGFFILFENLYLVGDLIEVESVKGRVEAIGLRVTKLRDDFGVLHSMPNGDMRKVANHSRGYVNATVDISVAHEEDLQYVVDLLSSASQGLRDSNILSEAEVTVQEARESGVVLRTTVQVKPGMDGEISDRLRKHLLEALRIAGVGTPRVQHMVWMRERKDGPPALPRPGPTEDREMAVGSSDGS